MTRGRESESSEEDEEIYEVENLLDHRRANKERKIEYLVRWLGYPEEYDTWEAEKNIFSEELIEKYWAGQTMSRQEFLKGKKRKTAENKGQIKQNKKLKVEKTERTRLVSEPPSGLQWEDLIEVIDMFNTKKKELFGEVRWRNQEKSYMLSDIIRKHRPIPLLKYYESHMSFK
ncbi:hypothetical protein K501DRAFT_205824 [Backusella circina FSU 941]|nr:hypothetical protein K501DRAFT_205824 [Backusella circina FSU 941]